jgi:hypothetical protein
MPDILETTWPLWAAAFLYMIQAYLYARQYNYGMMIALAAYAQANFGLIYASLYFRPPSP